MKKLLFIVLLAFGMNANAQITLEHVYDTASMLSGSGYFDDQLMIVNFEVSGYRYIKICRTGEYFCIYDMNHTLLKKIDYSGFPNVYANNNDFLYFSEHLFNNDNNIEFMYTAKQGLQYSTYIYNEDNLLLFSDTGAAAIRINYEQQQMPIYNTSQGTKMILSYRNGQAKVFSLPGTLTTAIADANSSLLEMQSQSLVSNAYPNPTSTTTQIDYKLPDGVNEGEIVFYDMAGNEVKRFKVDRAFNTLLLSTADIEAGTYLYQLQTTAQSSEGKKMVVIK